MANQSVDVTYYGYNAFSLDCQGKSVITDPGRSLDWRRLGSLVPRQTWDNTDLVLVTHGDTDHADYALQLARLSNAPIVCGRALAEKWRGKGVSVVPLSPGERTIVGGIPVTGVPVVHGPTITILGRRISLKPWFVGVGSIGFLFTLGGRRFLNLGDTVLLTEAWRGLQIDLLFVPTGGAMTMDVPEALAAISAIEPKTVIPMHYNWDILGYHRATDIRRFEEGVESMGIPPIVLEPGQSASV